MLLKVLRKRRKFIKGVKIVIMWWFLEWIRKFGDKWWNKVLLKKMWFVFNEYLECDYKEYMCYIRCCR